MHSIGRRGLSVLASCAQLSRSASRCYGGYSEMDKLTLNDSSHMIDVTPLSEGLCQASGCVALRERNTQTSLDKLSREDSGVVMSTEMQPNISNIRDVSEQSIKSTNADTGCRVLTEEITSCGKMHSEHTVFCADESKPLLPLGVTKVTEPPLVSKSSSRLPPDLLSRVTELIQQNPDLSQRAVGQTGRGKRVCEYEERRLKRRRAVKCRSTGICIGENDGGSPILMSSSEPGSLLSSDVFFWDSPLLSQSDEAPDVKTDVTCVHGEKVHGDDRSDRADTASECDLSLVCNAGQVSPVSSASGAFADTDKSVHTDDLCGKLCESVVQGEKQTTQRKQKKKKERGAHNETSAGIDDDETSSKKKPPNYFIAIQISNPEVHERLRAVQEGIVSRDEQLRTALVPLATLHLTLMVMRLSDSAEQLARAKQTLDSCGRKLRNEMSSGQLHFKVHGLSNFRNSVVFAKVAAGPILDALKHIAETVTATFAEECGILPIDTNDFKPHLTILKLSRSPNLRKQGVRKIDPDLYRGHMETTFGSDSVHNIQLCSMYKPKDEKGYYHVDHTVAVRNYSTTTMPPGGNVMHSRNSRMHCGSKESQNGRGEKGADLGTKNRVVSEMSPGTFTEHLEVMLEWTFQKPKDS